MNGNKTRLINYLKKLGFNPIKKSQGDSYYFKIGNFTIRISNHLPVVWNNNEISIVVPCRGSEFSVFINKNLYILNSLKEMKLFLYHFIILREGISYSTSFKADKRYRELQSKYTKLCSINNKNVAKLTQVNNALNKTNNKLSLANNKINTLETEIKILNVKIEESKQQLKSSVSFGENRSNVIAFTNSGNNIDIYRLSDIKKSLKIQMESILRKITPIKTLATDV